MTIREFSRRLLGRLALPQPTGDRVLNVIVTDAQVPHFGIKCLCTIAAWRAWRAAHENGCSKIVVHNGPVHKHAFDTVDLYRKVLGPSWVPSVFRINGQTPRLLATRGFQALGDVFETTRPTFNIPFTAVSSPVTGGKELVHG